MVQSLSPAALKLMLSADDESRPVLIDVREVWEFETARIEGAENIPMASIPTSLEELSKAAATVVVCHHGMRSMQVANYLASQGFTKVFNLEGGIDAWSREVDPSVTRY